MNKSTVYLPDELKARLAAASRVRNVSEASLIREALDKELPAVTPRPRGGILSGYEPIADRVDELLVGFGE